MVTTIIANGCSIKKGIFILLSLTGITEGNTLFSWIQDAIAIPFFLLMGLPVSRFLCG
jgi:Na+/H+ antiporter NhaA